MCKETNTRGTPQKIRQKKLINKASKKNKNKNIRNKMSEKKNGIPVMQQN